MVAIFPKGLFSWVNRIDQQDIDYANDPNSLAGEVISVESTLGVQPQVEKNTPTGGTQTYKTVDARISDTLSGSNKPVVELVGYSQNVATGQSVYNTYAAQYDPHNCFNGRDITIPCNGWWIVTGNNIWEDCFMETGFSLMQLQINANPVKGHCWRWDRPNFNLWPIQQGSAASGFNEVVWQGLLHQGDRVSISSTNGTFRNPHVIANYDLKASFVRTITGSFTSG
jgi:hypothetical protein